MCIRDRYTGEEMPLARSLIKGEVIENEQLIVQLEDGTEKWAAAWSAPILDENNNIIAAIVLFYDITEHKQTVQALKDSEQYLLNINATKDKFFSIIAHDLKSPFSGILGLSNLMVQEINNKNIKHISIEKYAGMVQRASQKTMDLLLNLIEWSSSQTNRMEFKPEFIELGNLINESVQLLINSADQKSITISTEHPDISPIYADKNMISSIFRNLISNAIKFTNHGGKIIISIENMTDNWLISVSDNGIGINEDRLNKLFRIEENISTPGTQNETGTGLGLILSKEFVEKHNGKIWAESKFGIGSTFKVSLPLDKSYNL